MKERRRDVEGEAGNANTNDGKLIGGSSTRADDSAKTSRCHVGLVFLCQKWEVEWNLRAKFSCWDERAGAGIKGLVGPEDRYAVDK